MVNLVRSYSFINDSKNAVGCVFDWFEVRVKALPLISELSKYGYSADNDKGCATHLHYFETDDFSVSWDIKSSYINKCWSHFRVKNSVFYGVRGFNSIVEYVQSTCKRIFDCGLDDIIVSRIDFAYDMRTGSFEHNLIRSRFENRFFDCGKYTEFHGKVAHRIFTNYSAGNRGSRVFMRLYYKTIENTDYHTSQPKKQYIADFHKRLFGVCDVVRFEIEWKPQGNVILSELVYQHFLDFWEKYVNDGFVVLFLGEYNENENSFSKVKAQRLLKLLQEFNSFYPDSSAFVSDVVNGCQQIIERV